MRGELWRYMRREMTNSVDISQGSDEVKINLIQHKLLDSKVTKLIKEVEGLHTQAAAGSPDPVPAVPRGADADARCRW